MLKQTAIRCVPAIVMLFKILVLLRRSIDQAVLRQSLDLLLNQDTQMHGDGLGAAPLCACEQTLTAGAPHAV